MRVDLDGLAEKIKDEIPNTEPTGLRNMVDQMVTQIRKDETALQRLSAALVQCSLLAQGDHHLAPSDRCEAIVAYVSDVMNGR